MFFLLGLCTLFVSFLAHLPFLDAFLGAYAQSVFQSSRAGRFIAIIWQADSEPKAAISSPTPAQHRPPCLHSGSWFSSFVVWTWGFREEQAIIQGQTCLSQVSYRLRLSSQNIWDWSSWSSSLLVHAGRWLCSDIFTSRTLGVYFKEVGFRETCCQMEITAWTWHWCSSPRCKSSVRYSYLERLRWVARERSHTPGVRCYLY